LSRININDANDNDSQMVTSMEPLIVNGSLIKRQQLNGLNNARNLSNLIGLNENIINHAQSAQPNDYCSSGRIGALINNNKNKNNNESLLVNENIFSDNNNRGGHYLMPCNPGSHYGLNNQNQMVRILLNFYSKSLGFSNLIIFIILRRRIRKLTNTKIVASNIHLPTPKTSCK